MTTLFVTAWIGLLVMVLVVEGFALFNEHRQDTLSENIWRLLKTLPGALVVTSLWFWLTYHFFLAPVFFPQWFLTNWIPDFIAIGLGLLAGYGLYKKGANK